MSRIINNKENIQRMDSMSNLEKVLWVCLVIFIQISFGQIFALISLLFILCLYITKIVIGNQKVILNYFLLLLFWIMLIVIMLRPNLMDKLVLIELIWLLGGAIFLFIAAVNSTIQIQMIRNIILMSSGFVAWLFIFEKLINIETGLFFPNYAGTRAVGGFDGPNEMGAFYLLVSSISLTCLLLKIGSIKINIFALIPSVVMVFLSYSRGALGGLALLLFLLVLLIFPKSRNKLRILLIFTFIMLILVIVFSNYIESFDQVRRNAAGRSELFQQSLDLIVHSPIFGNGMGTYATLYGTTPHNEYIYILVSGGIVAFIGLITILSIPIYLSYRYKFYPELVFFIIFLSQEMFFNHFVRGRVSLLFWLVFLVVIKSARLNYNKSALEG